MARKTSRPERGGRGKKGDVRIGGVWGVLTAAFITFAAGIILIYIFGGRPFPPKRVEKIPAREINLYLSNAEGTGLKAEKHSIKKEALSSEVKEALGALIGASEKDPEHTIPKGTRLLSVKVENTIAYVNLSREFSANHPGGSSAELQTIYSIVNTLALNFPEIKKVQLLIEGEVQDTLAGHIVISIPLGPDRGLIKG
ncbi:MAG: GerMN domain-containing protein [Deltaproteobacteria bacterium]|nr:GerMN domain-containing protein [Deltaproteobacteria bacterium]